MRFSARSSSSAPVTTRRSSRTVFHLLAQRRRRARPAGSPGRCADARCSWPPSGMPWRASQASSAVKQRIGASQAVRQSNSSVEHGAGGAAAQRVGRDRNRARPCGCRNRRPRDRRRRNCAARSKIAWKSKSSTRLPQHARRARPGDAAPSARAPASRRRPTAPLRVEAVEAAQQIAQRVAQAAIGVGLVLQDLRADALVLGVVGADHPQAQDVGAVLVASPSCGAMMLPSDFDILRPSSSSVKPCVSTRVVGRAAARAAGSPAARNGTSRDAGRSLRDRARPAI